MSDNSHHESHSGQQDPQKQMLVTVLKSFLIPAVLIAGYVAVTTPASKVEVSADAQDKLLIKRIQKVGAVEIRSASGDDAKQARSGEDVFKGNCSSCHATGAAGAPKVADTAAWSARIKTGFDTLLTSAKKGKGSMPAQAGGDLDDLDIARAVVYMANASGAKFAEPKAAASK